MYSQKIHLDVVIRESALYLCEEQHKMKSQKWMHQLDVIRIKQKAHYVG